jgi:lipid-binding SYLF domain-containing protein
MRTIGRACVMISWLAFALSAAPAFADSYSDTIALFQNAGASSTFFDSSYGYAVLPTIGNGGFILGGAHGNGRVYRQGKYVGDTSMTQLSIGFQAGAEAYSEIIFFHDQRALDEFTSGEYEFDGNVSAIALTTGASASAGTASVSASASGGKRDATTAGEYLKGIAVFTIAKGGLMYEVSVAGQRFSFDPSASEAFPTREQSVSRR